MLCATLSFSLILSSIASTNGDLLGFIFLTLLPIRNPQTNTKQKQKNYFSIVIPSSYPLPYLSVTIDTTKKLLTSEITNKGYASLNPKSLFKPSSAEKPR